ncbi:MAG: alpha/beta fold hydrolase [Candidatus Hydrogenedens sp.]
MNILFFILLVLIALVLMFLGVVIFLLKYRVRGDFFNSNGCMIHYRMEGSGPPLILIHGYAVNADINWRWNGLIRKLKKHFTTISFDLRGHGLSDKPTQPGSYGIEMAKDVIRLMDYLNISKAYIMGYSMGGFTTLKLVTMYPERIIKAVVGGAGFEKVDGDNVRILMELVESLEKGKGYAPLTKALEPDRKDPPVWKTKLLDFGLNILSDAQAMANVMKQFPEMAVSEEQLKNNQVPVLAIVGTNDPLKAGVMEMEKYLSNARFIYLEGRDHMTAMTGTKFYNIALEFLQERK